MKTSKRELLPVRKKELEASIHDFERWLRKIKKVQVDAHQYTRFTFPRPSREDWIMVVKGSEVKFNTSITGNCSFEYYRAVVLHECFHLFVQNVPNKADAKRLRDDFGDLTMRILDIEADYYTAMYYKEVRHMSLVGSFALNYEGSKIFGDPKVREGKLERFIGSILSVANAYFKNPGAKPTKENDLFIPKISNIPIEECMHILMSRKNHFMVSEIQADIHDFYTIKKCYAGVDDMGVGDYVQKLVAFAAKALKCPIPMAIYKQLHRIGVESGLKVALHQVA